MADLLAVGEPKGSGGAGGIPPEAKDKGSCKGLALKWDNNLVIRQRMREGFNLLVNFDAKLKVVTNSIVEKTQANVRVNSVVLQPVCQLIYATGLLNIEDLEHEVKQLYSMNTVLVSPKTIIEQAWAIRYLVQVLKGSVKAFKDDKERIRRCPKDSRTTGWNMLNWFQILDTIRYWNLTYFKGS